MELSDFDSRALLRIRNGWVQKGPVIVLKLFPPEPIQNLIHEAHMCTRFNRILFKRIGNLSYPFSRHLSRKFLLILSYPAGQRKCAVRQRDLKMIRTRCLVGCVIADLRIDFLRARNDFADALFVFRRLHVIEWIRLKLAIKVNRLNRNFHANRGKNLHGLII